MKTPILLLLLFLFARLRQVHSYLGSGSTDEALVKEARDKTCDREDIMSTARHSLRAEPHLEKVRRTKRRVRLTEANVSNAHSYLLHIGSPPYRGPSGHH